MTQEIILDGVTEEEYLKSASKFVTFPPDAKVGDLLFLDVECQGLDWDNPGTSLKIPVVVTEEGQDKGKEDKVSFGAGASGIWKGKALYANITGGDMPMKAGSDGVNHPAPSPLAIAGKPAVGMWTLTKGTKGGVEGGEPTTYPKLMDILPAGSKPQTESLGIG